MYKNLIFLRKVSDISEASFNKILKITTFHKVPANTLLVKPGTIRRKLYMLVSGVISAFVTDESGKQFNKRLFTPISFAGALTAMIKNKANEINYITLTDCKIYEIDFDKLKNLCEKDFEISKLYIKILENVFVAYEERSLDLMRLNATEKYLKLRNEIEDIDNLIPQYQIASYLNITPIQLSRIRKKLNII